VLEGLRRAFRGLVESVTTEELTEEKLEDVLEGFRLNLIANEVSVEASDFIAERVKGALKGKRVPRFSDRKELILGALRQALEEVLLEADPKALVEEIRQTHSSRGDPYPVLFVGPNGGGKTTTVAKIALYLKRNGLTPVIACSDTFRAAAIEQMRTLAERVGVRCVSQKYGADPAAVAVDAIASAKSSRAQVVLIDTAGRSELNRNLLEEMRKIKRVAMPRRVIYVGDALSGNAAVEQARQFDAYVGVDYVVLTKLDSDVKGGTAISVCYAVRKPILFVGIGQDLGDLAPFSKSEIIERVLGEQS
jgi:fused signal recognition particle receptor